MRFSKLMIEAKEPHKWSLTEDFMLIDTRVQARWFELGLKGSLDTDEPFILVESGFTTDFGTKAHFVGSVKGALISQIPDVKIFDISHNIAPFSVIEAAYVIQNVFDSFPKGSIHIIGVDSELSPENKHIAIMLDGHYFICANNGILSMVCADNKPEKIVEINNATL